MMKTLPFLLLLLACNNNSSSTKDVLKDSTAQTVKVDSKQDTIVTVAESETNLNTTAEALKLTPHPIHLQKGIEFSVNIPEGYNIGIAAEGLHRLRFLSKSPDERLFATDMYDRSDNKKGKVLIFNGWNSSTKKYDTVLTYLQGLHNPNQVAFFGNHIYIAETGRLIRYIYKSGDNQPTGEPEVIATFPDYGLSYKYGGWHLTRSIAFHNDKLYVSVGSSCNACIESEEVRASVMEMNADGTDKKIFARGVRNGVGMKWVDNRLWVTGMGRDLIGPDKPEDLFMTVEKDGYYGWPFYFQYQNNVYPDDQFKDSARAAWVKKPPVAFAGFKAHSAPLGFDFLKGFADPQLNNSFLVCLHGSTSVWRERGNSIVQVIGGNKYVDVVSGFLTGKTEAGRHGRPCDILMTDDHSFFFTDDLNGVLYYVWK